MNINISLKRTSHSFGIRNLYSDSKAVTCTFWRNVYVHRQLSEMLHPQLWKLSSDF
jgi:hypothetical protein